MGISAGGNSGFKSDINVTPLVDVVLVLLIIFLMTMPVLMRHITIEVPRELDTDTEISVSKQITILGKADGSIVLNDGTSEQSINRVDLAKTLRPLLEEKKTEKIVFVDYEDPVPWEDVVGIMDTVKGAAKKGPGRETFDGVKIGIKIRDKAAGGGL